MEYKVSELAQKAGVTKRTIHFYISKGLLMPPKGAGVNSLYDDTDLERLNLIKKLQSEFMPLNKIREYIFNGGSETYHKEPVVKDVVFETISSGGKEVYIKENICNIFDIHYTHENAKKYEYIISNVKKYVEKMLED